MPGPAWMNWSSVRKVACRPAERIVIAPMNIVPSDRDLKYIGSLLDGLPVLEGNRIRATLFGSRWADFRVQSAAPKGPVLIMPATSLIVGQVCEDKIPDALSPTRTSAG